MDVIRTFIFYIFYVLLTIIYGATTLVIWALPTLWAHKFITSWTWIIIFLIKTICGVRYEIKGKHNIPWDKKPFVVLAKHQSSWETLFLQGLFWPSSTVMKKELLKIPFFGWGLRSMQPITINRTQPREALKQVKAQGAQRLQENYNIILFPEGTRVAPGEKGKYARSGADIAAQSNVPIIPVALNSGHCWSRHTSIKRPGLITVSLGEPIYPEGKNSKALIAEVEQWIEAEMAVIEANHNRAP